MLAAPAESERPPRGRDGAAQQGLGEDANAVADADTTLRLVEAVREPGRAPRPGGGRALRAGGQDLRQAARRDHGTEQSSRAQARDPRSSDCRPVSCCTLWSSSGIAMTEPTVFDEIFALLTPDRIFRTRGRPARASPSPSSTAASSGRCSRTSSAPPARRSTRSRGPSSARPASRCRTPGTSRARTGPPSPTSS